jgi:putative transposase
MHVHLVFVTKYRRNVFTKEVLDDLKIFFEKVCLDFESELVEFDGEDDHVHLLVNYPPKVSVSALVNSLKGVSSRMIRKRITLRSKRNSGAVRSGRPVILRGAVAVRRLRSSGSILSSSKLRRSPQNGFAVALFILALNGGVFRAIR